jgi:hypothetical protein
LTCSAAVDRIPVRRSIRMDRIGDPDFRREQGGRKNTANLDIHV